MKPIELKYDIKREEAPGMSITPQTRIPKRDGLFQGHRRNLKISWLLRNQFKSKFTSEEALGTFERPIKLYDY